MGIYLSLEGQALFLPSTLVRIESEVCKDHEDPAKLLNLSFGLLTACYVISMYFRAQFCGFPD